MACNVESSIPISADKDTVLKHIQMMQDDISQRAHILRGRGAPTEATTLTLAGTMEQWAADLARAWELLRNET